MRLWLFIEIALLLATIPCAYEIWHARNAQDALMALQIGTAMAIFALLLVQAVAHASIAGIVLVLSFCSFGCGFLLAKLYERWFR